MLSLQCKSRNIAHEIPTASYVIVRESIEYLINNDSKCKFVL